VSFDYLYFVLVSKCMQFHSALVCFLFFIKLCSMIRVHHLWLIFLPMVAARHEHPFPDISFKTFSQFIENNFSSSISLTTVLMILFSMTENTTLLSLHARQQSPIYSREISTVATGWIRSLARSIVDKNKGTHKMMKKQDIGTAATDQQIITLSLKLDGLAKVLKLHPFNKHGEFTGKLKPVSLKGIKPALVICPDSVVCETLSCQPRSLLQWTKTRDIPMVTLVKDFMTYQQVPVLAGHCPDCKTTYYADHERTPAASADKFDRVYLNSAKYIKIGQSIWVDRPFTSAVLSGIYHFHASANSYTQFWNSAFCHDIDNGRITRRQIWQAFVQESIRLQASESGMNFTIEDGLSIDNVTKLAFEFLGNNGVIKNGLHHDCSECTHKFKETSDVIGNVDPSSVVGMENVPVASGPRGAEQSDNADNDDESATVKMVVLDGIVMGHTVSSVRCSKAWYLQT
jgi:hypothetical protein